MEGIGRNEFEIMMIKLEAVNRFMIDFVHGHDRIVDGKDIRI